MTIAERPVHVDEPLELELDPSVERQLHDHEGEWVAMTRDQLLATGATAEEVWQAARDLGVESPIVYLVPSDAKATYYY